MTRTSARLLAGVLVLAMFGIAAWRLQFAPRDHEATNDAYVSADYTVLAPKVAGFVKQVLVEDNQPVTAGQTLAVLDDRDYQASLQAAEARLAVARAQQAGSRASRERQASLIRQAEATVQSDDAALAFARHELTRYEHLAGEGAGSVQNAQQARSRVDQATARLASSSAALVASRKQLDLQAAEIEGADGSRQQAEAAVAQAQLDLSYTRLVAPVDGTVGEKAVRTGAYVTPGTRLLAIVPLEQAYVVGNFQETQLARVAEGQAVQVRVDTFPGETLSGRVQSIAPATGVTFAAIKPDNATGNFTKVVQRIPVKVVLDAGQPLARRLRVGMSADVSIETRAADTVEARLP